MLLSLRGRPYIEPYTRLQVRYIEQGVGCAEVDVSQTLFYIRTTALPPNSIDHYAPLASRMVDRNLFTASSTSSSLSKLKLARTYAVLPPRGKNTVPGSASTPRSYAFVRMTLSESPSSPSSASSSLNLCRRASQKLLQTATTKNEERVCTKRTSPPQAYSIPRAHSSAGASRARTRRASRDRTAKPSLCAP